MATGFQISQPIDMSTPLGALIAHFNASSKSVQKSFAKWMINLLEQEEQEKLQAKVENGVKSIKAGQGVSRKEGESTIQFFERLCTE